MGASFLYLIFIILGLFNHHKINDFSYNYINEINVLE